MIKLLGRSFIFAWTAAAVLTLPLVDTHAEEATPTPEKSSPARVDPRERIDRFFSALARDRVEEAYTGLVEGSILVKNPEDLEKLKTRTQQALDAYGIMRGYEVLEQGTVGTALKRFTCISLNEDLPLRWRFYFYLNPQGWKLVDLRVDDGLVELFDELGRSSP